MTTFDRAARDAKNVRHAFQDVARANDLLARNPSDHNVELLEAAVTVYRALMTDVLARMEDTEYASVYANFYSDLTFNG